MIPTIFAVLFSSVAIYSLYNKLLPFTQNTVHHETDKSQDRGLQDVRTERRRRSGSSRSSTKGKLETRERRKKRQPGIVTRGLLYAAVLDNKELLPQVPSLATEHYHARTHEESDEDCFCLHEEEIQFDEENKRIVISLKCQVASEDEEIDFILFEDVEEVVVNATPEEEDLNRVSVASLESVKSEVFRPDDLTPFEEAYYKYIEVEPTEKDPERRTAVGPTEKDPERRTAVEPTEKDPERRTAVEPTEKDPERKTAVETEDLMSRDVQCFAGHVTAMKGYAPAGSQLQKEGDEPHKKLDGGDSRSFQYWGL